MSRYAFMQSGPDCAAEMLMAYAAETIKYGYIAADTWLMQEVDKP